MRAERGRRLRELMLRDPLTGLLNHATLLAELEYAVDYGRRHGGPLSLLVFDLDRFHEVNERFGHLVGDQVLRHVANVFRSSVRASDLIGRFGGEEFAMVLRGVGAEGAAVVAAKLRRVLGEQSATTAEGVIIPLHVSVGWACFPATAPARASWSTPRCARCSGRRAIRSEDGEAGGREGGERRKDQAKQGGLEPRCSFRRRPSLRRSMAAIAFRVLRLSASAGTPSTAASRPAGSSRRRTAGGPRGRWRPGA